MNIFKTALFNTFSLTLILILLLVQFLSFYQSNPPVTEVQAAIINPPPPGSTPKPKPGQNYPISPALEQNLSRLSVSFDPEIPGIATTIPFGGRTWNTWQTNQEMDIITALETGTVELTPEQNQELSDNCTNNNIPLEICDNVDIILVAAVVGTVVVGTTVMIAGPGVMAFVASTAGRQVIAWSFNGILGAVTAGSVNIYSRFQSAPALLQGAGRIIFAFSSTATCIVVTRMPCEYLPDLQNVVATPVRLGTNIVEEAAEGLPGVVQSANRSGVFRTIANNIFSILPTSGGYKRLKTIAAQFEFKGAATSGAFGTVFFKDNEVIKLYHVLGALPNARIAREIESLVKAEGIPGIPKLLRVIRFKDINDVPKIGGDEVSLRAFYSQNGVVDEDVVGIIMERIPGIGIHDFKQKVKKGAAYLTQKGYDQAIDSYNRFVQKTGRGYGDHFGIDNSVPDPENYHFGNSVISADGNFAGFFDLGGDDRFLAGGAMQLYEKSIMETVLKSLMKP